MSFLFTKGNLALLVACVRDSDSWNLFQIFPETYISSFIKIGSVTAEILLTLSLCGGRVGWYAKSFSCLTQLKVMLGWVELWLSWGFDNCIFFNDFK